MYTSYLCVHSCRLKLRSLIIGGRSVSFFYSASIGRVKCESDAEFNNITLRYKKFCPFILSSVKLYLCDFHAEVKDKRLIHSIACGEDLSAVSPRSIMSIESVHYGCNLRDKSPKFSVSNPRSQKLNVKPIMTNIRETGRICKFSGSERE